MQDTLHPPSSPSRRLLPLTFVAFLGFLAVGIPLPVLTLFVRDHLGFSSFTGGVVVGTQSIATLFSRRLASRLCDEVGAKATSLLGLLIASVAGLCYLLAASQAAHPVGAVVALLLGRVSLGVGESLFITALAAWNVARVGDAHAGRVMAWSGISMYGAMALGAPFGTWTYGGSGFYGIALWTVMTPVAALLVAIVVPRALTGLKPPAPASYGRLLRTIWAPGLSMALASCGIGTLSAFLALLYEQMHWVGAGTAYTAFGMAYIAMRLFFAGLPDRLGGTITASFSLLIEVIGLALIWLAPTAMTALFGAVITGIGYSLVFPSLGVEALRLSPNYSRAAVLGAYLACFDLGLAMAGPFAGAVADQLGTHAVFPMAAAAAACSLIVVSAKLRRRRTPL